MKDIAGCIGTLVLPPICPCFDDFFVASYFPFLLKTRFKFFLSRYTFVDAGYLVKVSILYDRDVVRPLTAA